VAGSRPAAMSLSLIIEEGLEFDILEKILQSAAKAARENHVSIVAGDTKTVEAGSADKIFINTAGIGERLDGVELGFGRIAPGDKILINGTIGDHGMTIISQREGIRFESSLQSDCAGIAELTCQLLQSTDKVKFMRDPTRGGVAAALNEIARAGRLSMVLQETQIPIDPTVQAAADMLGFDLLTIANEGKFLAIVAREAADNCVNICRKHPLGRKASIIGEVVETHDVPLVEIVTRIGGRRIVAMPYGRELPRIC